MAKKQSQGAEQTSMQANNLINTMAALIQASAMPDGSNVILEALAQASGYTVVKSNGGAVRSRKHDCCQTLSPYKANGQAKATAADPIRTQEEFRAMREYLLNNGNARNRLRNYTIFICGITMGLRVGDLLRLTVGDVFCIEMNEPQQYVTLINQKTHKRTKDIITPMAASAIADLIEEMRENNKGVLDPQWPLFQSQKWCRAGGVTGNLSCSQVYRILTEAAEACGVQGHISTHSMRKTYGYIANNTLAYEGVPAAQIMETLQAKFRHSDQTTTMRYIGLQQEQIDATALSVDAMLE